MTEPVFTINMILGAVIELGERPVPRFDGYNAAKAMINPLPLDSLAAVSKQVFWGIECHSQSMLVSGNPDYPSITPRDAETLDVFGVVTNVIEDFHPGIKFGDVLPLLNETLEAVHFWEWR